MSSVWIGQIEKQLSTQWSRACASRRWVMDDVTNAPWRRPGGHRDGTGTPLQFCFNISAFAIENWKAGKNITFWNYKLSGKGTERNQTTVLQYHNNIFAAVFFFFLCVFLLCIRFKITYNAAFFIFIFAFDLKKKEYSFCQIRTAGDGILCWVTG